MNIRFILLIIPVVLVSLFCVPVFSANTPTCLIYDSDMGPGSNENDSKLVARTIKYYSDRSGRFESIIYNSDLPSVLLAVKKEMLTPNDIVSNAPVNSKIKVAKTLNFDYVAVSEVTKMDGNFVVSLSLYNLKNNEITSYNANTKVTSNDSQYNNGVHSVCSSIMSQVIQKIFNANPNFSSEKEKEQPAVSNTVYEDLSIYSVKDLIKAADKLIDSENYTEAIVYITKAIDKEPDNSEIRIKLSDVYFRKQMYKEALDTYYTAINMGYRGNDIMELKTKYESRVKTSSPAIPIKAPEEDDRVITITPPNTQNLNANKGLESISKLMLEADNLWRQNQIDGAIAKYNSIIIAYPGDYKAYERLVLIYANSQRFVEAASIIKTMNARGVDYDYNAVLKRTRTLYAIISEAYNKIISGLKGISYNMSKSEATKKSYYDQIKSYQNNSNNILILINQISIMDSTTNDGAFKLIGNLINSAASGYIDFNETDDSESLTAANAFLDQATTKLKQAVY